MKIPKLEAIKLTKTFAPGRGKVVTALEDFYMTLGENEFVSIIGPSGCGKSTFLEIAAGLDEVSSGQVLVDGIPVTGPGADRGMVFQSYTLFPWLTISENVRFALKKSSLSRSEQDERVQRFIQLIGLAGFENAYPNQLSGGMRQRVAIARALVYQPKILFMDEPFGALDAQTRLVMQELLLDVWESNRTSVLFVTHDVEEALLLSDRIYVMTARPGKIKSEYVVDLPRPRSLLITEKMPAFVDLRAKILEEIRQEVRL